MRITRPPKALMRPQSPARGGVGGSDSSKAEPRAGVGLRGRTPARGPGTILNLLPPPRRLPRGTAAPGKTCSRLHIGLPLPALPDGSEAEKPSRPLRVRMVTRAGCFSPLEVSPALPCSFVATPLDTPSALLRGAECNRSPLFPANGGNRIAASYHSRKPKA